MGACEKRARLRTRTGLLAPGDFSYYMGPVAPWVSGVTGGVWNLFARAFPNELSNYWAPVKKRARLRTRTRLLTSGNFSYYAGLSPAKFRAFPEGRGHLFVRVCPDELLNYWGPAEKRVRLRTRTGSLTSGDFSYYVGPIAQWASAVTRGDWAFLRAGLAR